MEIEKRANLSFVLGAIILFLAIVLPPTFARAQPAVGVGGNTGVPQRQPAVGVGSNVDIPTPLPITFDIQNPLPPATVGVPYPPYSLCKPQIVNGLCGGVNAINPEPEIPSGGSGGPYFFSLESFVGVPLGFSVGENGMLTGTIPASCKNCGGRTYTFTVCAKDSGGHTACSDVELPVIQKPEKAKAPPTAIASSSQNNNQQAQNSNTSSWINALWQWIADQLSAIFAAMHDFFYPPTTLPVKNKGQTGGSSLPPEINCPRGSHQVGNQCLSNTTNVPVPQGPPTQTGTGGKVSGHCDGSFSTVNACGPCTCTQNVDCNPSPQCGGGDCWTSGPVPPFCGR